MFSIKITHGFVLLLTLAGGRGADLGVPGPEAYELAQDDELTFRSEQVKELADKTFRIDNGGDLNLPMVGRVHVAGMRVVQVESAISKRFGEFYVNPEVSASVTEYRKNPVSVMGAVGTPGTVNIRGELSLLEVLSQAGGLRPDAGPVARITRQKAYGALPLPDARQDSEGASIAEIDLKSLLEARDSSLNIKMRPHDVVTVVPGQSVFVVGTVKRAGGFPLAGRPRMSVLEALSLAGGLDIRASAKRARILRPAPGNTDARQEVLVDLSKILEGTSPDQYLAPNDILFVPNSAAKNVTFRSLEAALQIGTGMLILRPF